MTSFTSATNALALSSSPDCWGRSGVMHRWVAIATMLSPITTVIAPMWLVSAHARPVESAFIPDMPGISPLWLACPHVHAGRAMSATAITLNIDVILLERFSRNILVTPELEEVGNIYPDVTSSKRTEASCQVLSRQSGQVALRRCPAFDNESSANTLCIVSARNANLAS